MSIQMKALCCGECKDGVAFNWKMGESISHFQSMICENCGSNGKWQKRYGERGKSLFLFERPKWEWSSAKYT